MFLKSFLSFRFQLLALLVIPLIFVSLFFINTPLVKASTIEDLQSQINALMALIEQIRQNQTTSVSPIVTASTTAVVQIGTNVSVTAPLRVRNAPGITSLFIATQPIGSTGTVVEGPVVKDGYNWFKVDYVTGTDGWNVGAWLRARTDLPDVLGTYIGYMNGEFFITTKSISRPDALADCKAKATNNPASVVRCTWRGSEIFVSTDTKSTPRIEQASGPADASYVSARIVFGTPSINTPAVSGPTNIGSINWGDGSAVEIVNELITGTTKSVSRRHTYAGSGSYTITAIGLDGKTDTKTVSISVYTQPRPTTVGIYRGYKSGRLFIETPSITKADAQTACQTGVVANPTTTFRCEWNGKVIFATGVIYENPDIPVRVTSVTNSKNPVVSGTASGTDSVHIILGDLTGGDASVVNGMWSYTSTVDFPTGKYVVTAYVNSAEVARRDFSIQLSDVTIATTTPNRNAFGCGRTETATFANGVVACYGMWDYGSSFGNDHYVCGNPGQGTTGCMIKTKACTSGNAKATAYYAGSDLTATKLNTVSARLHTTTDVAKNEIAGLWEYSCIPAPAPATATTTGAVLGASTDIYSEMSASLANIASLLSSMMTK